MGEERSIDQLPKTLALIAQGRDEGLHHGVQLYVSRHGKTIVNSGWGLASVTDGETTSQESPMRPNTINLWLSSGKPLTAMAIAQLWEQSKLQLDDLVSKFIPAFAINGKERITIRHLLTHTGGFRQADQFSVDLDWDERIQQICDSHLEEGWIPGQKAGYHTTSAWFLLGEIVQRIDGRTVSEYLRDEIFEPIGMQDTWLGMPRKQLQSYRDENRVATMFTREGTELRPHSFFNGETTFITSRPGSNARGPIRDLGRFYEFLLGHMPASRPIFNPETIHYFTQPHRVGMFDHTFLHTIDFGLGFILNSNRYGMETIPYSYGRHASEQTFGHSGAQSSTGFADPSHGLAIAWVFNGMAGERKHQKRAREINSAIYEDLGLGTSSRD